MALAASACSAMTAPRLCIPDEASCHSIVYEHMSTICTHLHLRVLSFPYQSSRLQLADEQAGGEQADALRQDVLGEDVDEGGQQDEGHGGLVDEEEGDQLGHGRLEDGLAVLATLMPLSMYSMRVYHLLRADLGGLLLLLAGERGAGHDGRTHGGGRAESGPGEGAEEAGGVHRGRSASLRSAVRARRSANCCGRAWQSGIDALEKCLRPGEMRGDGVAGGGRRSW